MWFRLLRREAEFARDAELGLAAARRRRAARARRGGARTEHDATAERVPGHGRATPAGSTRDTGVAQPTVAPATAQDAASTPVR